MEFGHGSTLDKIDKKNNISISVPQHQYTSGILRVFGSRDIVTCPAPRAKIFATSSVSSIVIL